MTSKNVYAGLFFVTLSTLMFEILLTRIFSVTMWYHFAFVAISICMFGMTAGACIIYLFPKFFTKEKVHFHLSLGTLLFSLSIIFSFLSHLSIPFVSNYDLLSLFSIGLNYFIVSIPFIFSGIIVTLVLTRFPSQISKLYAADLAGASIGCIALIYILDLTGDAPTTVFVVAWFASVGSILFTIGTGFKKIIKYSVVLSLLLLIFIAFNTYLANIQKPLIKLTFVKGEIDKDSEYERWNSFSRIKIYPQTDEVRKTLGWGVSSVFPKDRLIDQYKLDIDASAATFLTRFNGNFNTIDHLRYDVTNIVHYIKNNGNILVVGAGGGRDVLAALMFGQKSIEAVEINENIINVINGRYGDYTGHLDRYSNVKFINDEARSYLARSDHRYDIIQVSLIDTWAATAAGAFVLTENSLYTMEAWNIMLNKLSNDGIISISRWYYRDKKSEMYRLFALATAALKEIGINDTQNHIAIIRNLGDNDNHLLNEGIGTLLTSKKGFTKPQLDTLRSVCSRLNFEIAFSPEISLDSTFNAISADKNSKFIDNYPLNIKPPTDDNPYFFHLLKFASLFNIQSWKMKGMTHNYKAVMILGALLFIVVLLTVLCIVIPLKLGSKNITLKGSLPYFTYFIGIGFGFMFIEISQMQRLIMFLGHPVYGLSVVLFSLLLSGGIGSLFTDTLKKDKKNKSNVIFLLILLIIIISFGIITPFVIHHFQSSITAIRIIASIAILIPLGFFMGMAFPTGLKLASINKSSLTSWLWGINGATSVCASVLAVVIAMIAGISATYWFGFVAYVVAFLSYKWIDRIK